MDTTWIDALTKRLGTIDRKTSLKVLGGTLAAASTARLPGVAHAKKRKNKKKRRCPKPPSTRLCTGTCADNCSFCFTRPDAPSICSDSLQINCTIPCATDSECLGAGHHYCIRARVTLATGELETLCAADPAGGHCGSLAACV